MIKTLAPIHGFKGFDQALKCRDFQYKLGETYEIAKDKVRVCEKGFHFCENPFDVWNYYPPISKFTHVIGGGKIEKEEDKIACSKITIGTEITLNDFIGIGVKFILNKVNWKDSAATNTGYQSAATNTGERSAATVEGKESVAITTGFKGKARGKIGNWIVLTERDENMKIKSVKSFKIDGKKIKEDMFYMLIDGKAKKVD